MVFTDYATGCIRNLLLKSYGLQESLKQETSARGAANEARFIRNLAPEEAVGVEIERNSPCNAVTPAVEWGGRSDLVRLPDKLGDAQLLPHIWELKSTGSKNKLRDLRVGKYTTENLAQLVAYMSDFAVDTGSLVYSYYAVNKDSGFDEMLYEREFKVTIDDVGMIVVDNQPTAFHVADQLDHRLAAAEALDNNIVWDRPYNWSASWGSPCTFCPFKNVCDRYDQGSIRDVNGFVTEASKVIGVKKA